jgi:hypothetical protein
LLLANSVVRGFDVVDGVSVDNDDDDAVVFPTDSVKRRNTSHKYYISIFIFINSRPPASLSLNYSDL